MLLVGRKEKGIKMNGIMISTECVNENEVQIQISPFFQILKQVMLWTKKFTRAKKEMDGMDKELQLPVERLSQ